MAINEFFSWALKRAAEVVALLAIGSLLIIPGAFVYDVFRFHRVRAQLNATLEQLSPSERSPTTEVKRSFRFEEVRPQMFSSVAWIIFRDGRRGYYPGFEEKLEAAFVWTPLIRLLYTEEEVFGVYLHGYRAAMISREAYDKDLNDLSSDELRCVANYFRSPSYKTCPELQHLPSRKRSGDANSRPLP
ncbi:MAG: hypothetical protein ABL996_14930 [Micropepsaceae bacterium]